MKTVLKLLGGLLLVGLITLYTFRTPDTSRRQTLCHKHRRYHRRYI